MHLADSRMLFPVIDSEQGVLPDTTGHDHGNADQTIPFFCIIMHSPYLYLELAAEMEDYDYSDI